MAPEGEPYSDFLDATAGNGERFKVLNGAGVLKSVPPHRPSPKVAADSSNGSSV
jgi:hypothetical protein